MENFTALKNELEAANFKIAELEKTLKMVREIGVESQRKINRKQYAELLESRSEMEIWKFRCDELLLALQEIAETCIDAKERIIAKDAIAAYEAGLKLEATK